MINDYAEAATKNGMIVYWKLIIKLKSREVLKRNEIGTYVYNQKNKSNQIEEFQKY